MEDLGTEVGQLGRLIVVECPHRSGVLHDTRVVIVHPVDVGPYLNLLGIEDGANDGGGVVAAAALEVVHLGVGIEADVSLSEEERLRRVVGHRLQEAVLYAWKVRLAILVGADEVESAQPDRIFPLLPEVELHHPHGDNLALTQDLLGLVVTEESLRLKAPEEAHLLVDEDLCQCLRLLALVEGVDGVVVLLLQLVDQAECALDIGVGKVVTDLDQRIGDATHGTEDHDLEAIVLNQ